MKKANKQYCASKAYLKFESVVQRSLNMLEMQELLEKILSSAGNSAGQKTDCSDLTRAAVVLAIAAMDAYFTDSFVEHLIPYLKKYGPTDDLVDLLTKAGINTKCVLVPCKN